MLIPTGPGSNSPIMKRVENNRVRDSHRQIVSSRGKEKHWNTLQIRLRPNKHKEEWTEVHTNPKHCNRYVDGTSNNQFLRSP